MKDFLNKVLSGIDDNMRHEQKIIDGLSLLEKVWRDVGPYNRDKVSEDTLRELRDYFEFDDSE
jgi:hypothetical protein